MTTTIDRAEINRRNAARSTGPRTPEGKSRSRFNAVKHGCRARLPILPGEDPEVYQRRLDAWVDKFGPRDAVEHYLVERAVHVSWQLDRADRAELAGLVADLDREAEQRAEEVRSLGSELFAIPPGPIGGAPVEIDGAERTLLSWPFEPEHSLHPSRLVAALEATAAGCDWLREEWTELGRILDAGRNWKPFDRVRAIRLLGKQPLDAIADEQVMSIYLAGHAMDPGGPDVFAEPLGDLHRPEMSASRERQAARFAAARAERAPRNPSEARTALRAIAAAGAARAEALREVRAADEAAERADIAARLSYQAKLAVEWLHKHQVTCSRALFRTFAELRRLRQDFAADPSMAEASAGSPASGPCGDNHAPMTPPAGPREDARGPAAVAAREADESPSQSGGHRQGGAPSGPLTPGLIARPQPLPPAPATSSESWAPRPAEAVERDQLPPTDASPAAIQPVAAADAPTVTNEASVPPETERAGGDPTATNEASSGDGEVETGAGADCACEGPPHIPPAADVAQSDPAEEAASDVRGEGPVGCSSSTVMTAACVPIIAIAGASASMLGESPMNQHRAARIRRVRAPIGWVTQTSATKAEFPLIRPWFTFSPAPGERGSRDAPAERARRRRAPTVRFRPAAAGRGSG